MIFVVCCLGVMNSCESLENMNKNRDLFLKEGREGGCLSIAFLSELVVFFLSL